MLKIYFHALKKDFTLGLQNSQYDFQLQGQNAPLIFITSRVANSPEFCSQNKRCNWL